ncbi:MAG: class I SAM-dependent methyltransferase [Pseudomonadota bacterium]
MEAEGRDASPLDDWLSRAHLGAMGLLRNVRKSAGRARYTAAQGIRSAWYGGQYMLARRRSAGFNRPGDPVFKPRNKPDVRALRQAFFDLFRQDRENVEAGLYPDPVNRELRLRDLPSSIRRAQRFLKDVSDVDRRRLARDGTEVRSSDAADPARFPAYYRQNFHYQTDGWLSEDSAEIYDHQVEALFTGAADAMRRLALAELIREVRGQDQRNVRVLDLACGTGRFMRQMMTAMPRLDLTGLDLSPPYARTARRHVSRWPHVDVVESAAEAMPFEDSSFDHLISIYLFHELPPRIRPQVMAEAARVLKPGGTFIIADSLQFGDHTGLDGFLEYFPEGFHEPYYKGYLDWAFDPHMETAGFTAERLKLAFLTKIRVWRKQ